MLSTNNFHHVYTNEDVPTLLDLGASPYHSIITEEVEDIAIDYFLTYRNHGPDEISVHLLKETAYSMTPILYI